MEGEVIDVCLILGYLERVNVDCFVEYTGKKAVRKLVAQKNEES